MKNSKMTAETPVPNRTRELVTKSPGATKLRLLETRICRTYRFESAHRLPFVPDGHKCKRMHGHNYRVDVVMRGKLDYRGFIRDFAEIDELVLPLIKEIDHRVLNEIDGLSNPTAENIAAWFFERIEGCEKVRVYENDDCWAETTL